MNYVASSFRTLLLLPLLLFALPAAADVPADAGSIVATATADGRFEVLRAALNQAGLTETLRGEGPFTVFAPTDEAFAALPEGTVAHLLKPQNRGALKRILLAHVVAGRVLTSDLLPSGQVETAAGAKFALGLRIGSATVVQTDIHCANGVIHVIDALLLPPAEEPKRERVDARTVIQAAIEKGAPLFNAGDPSGCAAAYRAAAEQLIGGGHESLSDLALADFERTLEHAPADASEFAWALRRAFDRTLADLEFKPTLEAELPVGFPQAGPLGRVVSKMYPKYRAARADGGMGTFWTLFRHIKRNKVEMTAPVEMTMNDDMRAKDMAFLYGSRSQGSAGSQGSVDVVDLDAVQVLSIGMRGRRGAEALKLAKQLIEGRLDDMGLRASGSWRVLGYNSPMVAASKQYWELQIPVTRK